LTQKNDNTSSQKQVVVFLSQVPNSIMVINIDLGFGLQRTTTGFGSLWRGRILWCESCP